MEELIINESINDICIYLKWILIFLNIYLVFYKHRPNGTGYICLLIYVILFCIFYIPKDGDIIGYYNLYMTGNASGHLEPFFEWTIKAIPQGFFYWRTTIWGTAIFIFILIFRKLNIEAGYATISFLAFSLLQNFYYLRNDLAFGVLFFSIVQIIYLKFYKRSKLFILIYIAIAFSSYYLHKSMPLYFVLSIIALYFPFKTRNIYLIILAFPVLYLSFEWIISLFLDSNIWINSERTTDVALNSIDSNRNLWSNSSSIGKLNLLFTFLPSLYLFIKSPKIIQCDTTIESHYMRFFLMTSFLTAIISFIYLFQGAETMHFRFWMTSLLPLTFFIAIFVKKYYKEKETKYFIILVILNWILTFLKTYL